MQMPQQKGQVTSFLSSVLDPGCLTSRLIILEKWEGEKKEDKY